MVSFVSSFALKRRNQNRFPPSHRRFMMQTPPPSQERRITLYSIPVSNYSARCRFLIKRKNLSEDEVSIRPPSDLGGSKTDKYLAMNPFGKIPAAVVSEGGREECIFESSVICEYLAEQFCSRDPSFLPSTPVARAKARMIANILDIYIGPYHPFMYKQGYEDRESGVKNMIQGFDALEHVLCPKGPYVIGDELSLGDCYLWGNWSFYDFMLPTFFGWNPIDQRPKLKAWRAHMLQESQAARDVYTEVFESLQGWWDSGRWTNLSMKPLTPRPELIL